MFKKVLIDTSLQIQRCKHSSQAQPVKDWLRTIDFTATSSFAKFEFKHSWLRDLAFLYTATKKNRTVSELLASIDKSFGNKYADRRYKRCVQIVSAVLEKVKGKLTDTEQLCMFQNILKNQIVVSFSWWDRSVTHIFDGTGCIRAKEPPEVRGGSNVDVYIPRCDPKKNNCKIHEFLKNNDLKLKDILAAIKSQKTVSQELSHAAKILESFLKNMPWDKNKSIGDQDSCLDIGDILIALDGLEMDEYAANNPKEWTTISAALGKLLVNPLIPTTDAENK